MGFTYASMLDAIFVTNTSKCANRASKALGWFGVDLVVNPLLATTFAFWPLLEPKDFLAFPIWD
jgi:hypothetical protein